MNVKRKDRGTIKDTSVTFPCTKEEKKKIVEAANDRGMMMSTFCRMVLKDFLKNANN